MRAQPLLAAAVAVLCAVPARADAPRDRFTLGGSAAANIHGRGLAATRCWVFIVFLGDWRERSLRDDL